MLTETDLVKLLQAAGENEYTDMKCGMEWDGGIQSAGLAKDIAAFANSKNGGVIVIGKSENPNGGFHYDGVTDDQQKTFETTKIASWINARFDPPVSLVCYHLNHMARTFILIEVSEFDDIPIICKKECYLDKKHYLKVGDIYIRGKNAESKPLQTTDELRRLIGLAVQKKGDELQSAFVSILKGKSLFPPEQESSPYDAELDLINESIDSSIEQSMDLGGWTFYFHPVEYEPERFTFSSLENLIRKNIVRVRSNEFPGSYKGYSPTEWGILNDFYGEVFGLTPSGLFVYKDAYPENTYKFENPWKPVGYTGNEHRFISEIPPGQWLEFQLVLMRIVEMVWFLSQFSHEYPPGTEIYVEIKADKLMGRQLATRSTNVSLDPTPPTKANKFVYEKTYSVETLITEWQCIAVDIMMKFFRLFPDIHPEESTYSHWVKNLTSR